MFLFHLLPSSSYPPYILSSASPFIHSFLFLQITLRSYLSISRTINYFPRSFISYPVLKDDCIARFEQ